VSTKYVTNHIIFFLQKTPPSWTSFPLSERSWAVDLHLEAIPLDLCPPLGGTQFTCVSPPLFELEPYIIFAKECLRVLDNLAELKEEKLFE
jgi:hypothetical protein